MEHAINPLEFNFGGRVSNTIPLLPTFTRERVRKLANFILWIFMVLKLFGTYQLGKNDKQNRTEEIPNLKSQVLFGRSWILNLGFHNFDIFLLSRYCIRGWDRGTCELAEVGAALMGIWGRKSCWQNEVKECGWCVMNYIISLGCMSFPWLVHAFQSFAFVELRFTCIAFSVKLLGWSDLVWVHRILVVNNNARNQFTGQGWPTVISCNSTAKFWCSKPYRRFSYIHKWNYMMLFVFSLWGCCFHLVLRFSKRICWEHVWRGIPHRIIRKKSWIVIYNRMTHLEDLAF